MSTVPPASTPGSHAGYFLRARLAQYGLCLSCEMSRVNPTLIINVDGATYHVHPSLPLQPARLPAETRSGSDFPQAPLRSVLLISVRGGLKHESLHHPEHDRVRPLRRETARALDSTESAYRVMVDIPN